MSNGMKHRSRNYRLLLTTQIYVITQYTTLVFIHEGSVLCCKRAHNPTPSRQSLCAFQQTNPIFVCVDVEHF